MDYADDSHEDNDYDGIDANNATTDDKEDDQSSEEDENDPDPDKFTISEEAA